MTPIGMSVSCALIFIQRQPDGRFRV